MQDTDELRSRASCLQQQMDKLASQELELNESISGKRSACKVLNMQSLRAQLQGTKREIARLQIKATQADTISKVGSMPCLFAWDARCLVLPDTNTTP
jgi:hypothetical protein